MKIRVFIILTLLFCIFGFNDFNTWQELDKQDASYVTFVHQGKYKKAYPIVERLARSGDANAQYTLAKMYDPGEHWISCHGYRDCHPNTYKPIDEFDLSKSKAKKWYKRAIKNGHPYAAYMLARHIQKDGKPVPDKNKQLAIESLLPRVEAGDGIATYMYYELTSYTFAITPQTTEKSNQKSKENLELIIALLLKEAKQGRILALHYLGKAYFHLWDYPKAFAWFTVASKNGFAPSGVYQRMVLTYIEKDGQEKETLKEINAILSAFEK